ncbi:uncharacterized protein LOC111625848 [Centruroides sculpturatus]|uniref:uncharacterized protein LOC111625848 n=1 Tax=Centruroides sculpturatus TaxID=218467 RepID=UPI000C6E49E8|nr:uncharacterized protein LOC111625848 [Centruroides sculpturatus]
MLFPYSESFSVNLNAWRSQDPTGSDLPLADLPTVRFFYNLGCDYFRMTSMMHVTTPSPYPAWTPCNSSISYAIGTPCSSIPVPMSECYDQRREDITQRNFNGSVNTQMIPPQPVIVGSPPSVSAHAIFYSSSLPTVSTPQTVISSPSYVASSLP